MTENLLAFGQPITIDLGVYKGDEKNRPTLLFPVDFKPAPYYRPEGDIKSGLILHPSDAPRAGYKKVSGRRRGRLHLFWKLSGVGNPPIVPTFEMKGTIAPDGTISLPSVDLLKMPKRLSRSRESKERPYTKDDLREAKERFNDIVRKLREAGLQIGVEIDEFGYVFPFEPEMKKKPI